MFLLILDLEAWEQTTDSHRLEGLAVVPDHDIRVDHQPIVSTVTNVRLAFLQQAVSVEWTHHIQL